MKSNIGIFLNKNTAPEPDSDRKKADFILFHEKISTRRLYGMRSLSSRIWEQAAFISPISWIMQFIGAVICVCIAEAGAVAETMLCLSVIVPLIGIIGSVELKKGYLYNMWELERTCRYDSKQVAGIKLFLFGLCDLILLMLFCCLILKAGGRFAEIGLYLLIPFNISTGTYLLTMEIKACRNNSIILLFVGFLMTAVNMMLHIYSEQYIVNAEEWTVGVGIVISALFMLIMAGRYYRKSDREDGIAWNLN